MFSDPAITLLFALLVVTAFVFIMFIFVATSPRKPKAPPVPKRLQKPQAYWWEDRVVMPEERTQVSAVWLTIVGMIAAFLVMSAAAYIAEHPEPQQMPEQPVNVSQPAFSLGSWLQSLFSRNETANEAVNETATNATGFMSVGTNGMLIVIAMVLVFFIALVAVALRQRPGQAKPARAKSAKT